MVRKRDGIDRRKVWLNATKRVQAEAEPLGEGMRKAVATALSARDSRVMEAALIVVIDMLEAARTAITELQQANREWDNRAKWLSAANPDKITV